MTPEQRAAIEEQYNRARDADLAEQAPMRKAIRAHQAEEAAKKTTRAGVLADARTTTKEHQA